MQFDFFKPLFTHRQAEPAPIETAPSPPTPRIEASSPPAEGQLSTITLPSAEELHAQATELLKRLGCAALAGRLVIRWNPRLRNTAGMAFPGRALITLNPRLSQFGLEEIDRTFRHELAHLLAQERVGRRRIDPHGKEWRQACSDLGLPGEKRSHDLPLPRHRVRPRHFYKCPGCGFELKRARPLKRNSACVKCCRAHNRGRYDGRFRFVATRPPEDAGH